LHELVEFWDVVGLQVFKAGKFFFEILSEVQQLLGAVNELAFFEARGGNESALDLLSEDWLLPHLLTNLEGDINRRSSEERGFLSAKAFVVKTHLAQILAH
jgi:hypothetical protein